MIVGHVLLPFAAQVPPLTPLKTLRVAGQIIAGVRPELIEVQPEPPAMSPELISAVPYDAERGTTSDNDAGCT